MNEDMNAWGYPRVVSREVAIQLFQEAQASARDPTRTECALDRGLGHDDRLIPSFVLLTEQDLIDFGVLRSAAGQEGIEILLSGSEWPDKGIWLVVRAQGNHCSSWALAPAIAIEQFQDGRES